jgi:putative glycosyltransferase (TIGR04348 family)
MLRDRYHVILQSEWDGKPADALIALHARRSAASIRAFHARAGGRRQALVLTGTDLYRDYPSSPEVHASLAAADCIVTLQPEAFEMLPAMHQRKAEVIFQSASALPRRTKSRERLECVAVGHLRDEKDPRTLFAAIRELPRDMPIRVRHIGAPLDETLGEEARELQLRDARYRYAGALPRGLARAAMQRAHLLVHPSAMEGGANVIVESVTARTPVIASRIPGNIGMLGRDYRGYFEPRDASGLAARLVQAWEERGYLATLARQCAERAKLFEPRREARLVNALVRRLLA